ncbi:hypothetical protein EDB81DRAFT_386981 [Dactylonectria macrodidyma]|uniref:Uncharacterized protein n=1 Tax=Dactylonectria macrodidyma TaxID=307937 RepID=A0A9P9JA16_9HYPO|nr:hypothetical protein EDB81DRAFT_386981 [Dactylonectria macrodidyma]
MFQMHNISFIRLPDDSGVAVIYIFCLTIIPFLPLFTSLSLTASHVVDQEYRHLQSPSGSSPLFEPVSSNENPAACCSLFRVQWTMVRPSKCFEVRKYAMSLLKSQTPHSISLFDLFSTRCASYVLLLLVGLLAGVSFSQSLVDNIDSFESKVYLSWKSSGSP